MNRRDLFDGSHPRIVQVCNSLMGRYVVVPPDPHLAGAPDRILTLALRARL